MLQHQVVFISIIIPFVIGIMKFNTLNIPYRILFYGTGVMLINQSIFILFKFSPVWNNIFNYVTVLIWLPLRVYNSMLWSDIKSKAKIIVFLISASILMIFSEVYWIGLDEYRTSIALSIITLLGTIIVVFIIVDLIKKKMLNKTKQSIMLFMIPFVIVNIYSVSIDIFLFFLYSSQTAEIFKKLYGALLYVASISYLCIAFSLLLAPKKEVFVEH